MSVISRYVIKKSDYVLLLTAEISLSYWLLVCFPCFGVPITYNSAGDHQGLPSVPNLIFFKPPIIIPWGKMLWHLTPSSERLKSTAIKITSVLKFGLPQSTHWWHVLLLSEVQTSWRLWCCESVFSSRHGGESRPVSQVGCVNCQQLVCVHDLVSLCSHWLGCGKSSRLLSYQVYREASGSREPWMS